MKKLYWVLVLVGIGTACQSPSSVKTSAVQTTASTVPVQTKRDSRAVVTAVKNKAAQMPDSSESNTQTPLPLSSLRRYDLASLWQGRYGDDSDQVFGAMEGFFGSDYRRIAFAFTSIRRDSLCPDMYWVKGKNRFQKVVMPFEGTIKISSFTQLNAAYLYHQHVLLDVDSTCKVYTVEANFNFREQSTKSKAGAFAGTAYLDFFLDGEGRLNSASSMMLPTSVVPAKGAGLLYKGQWTSYTSQMHKPLLLSGNVFITAPDALPNFSIGDRDVSFNPKYAKLGWNDFWANDEWWADSPKPTLGL